MAGKRAEIWDATRTEGSMGGGERAAEEESRRKVRGEKERRI